MSIKRMACVFEQSKHKGAPYYTLLALANFANDDGYCWPSIPTIAFHARISRSTAFEAIEQLLASGELIKLTSGHTGKNNEYVVTVGLSEQEVTRSVKHYTRPESGRVQYSDPSGNRTTPVQILDPSRPAAGLPPSGNRTPTVSNHHVTVTEPSASAPAQSASPDASAPAKKSRAKATVDPEYSIFHKAFFAHWDAQYKATTHDEPYGFNWGMEGNALKRSKLFEKSLPDVMASIDAFLRITERQDKYLANHRDISTFLRSWNHRILANARVEARQNSRASPNGSRTIDAMQDYYAAQRANLDILAAEKCGKSG